MNSSTVTVGLLLISLVACSSSGPATPASAAQTPGPLLMQYVGEYDGLQGPVASLTLHADGTFEATSAQGALAGTFAAAPSESGAARATLTASDGSVSTAAMHALSSDSGPARVEMNLAGAVGAATLSAPWIAGDEDMCDGTGGRWTDDDPDPATGLFCRCPERHLYVPSRGGCVAPASSGDPARVPLDERTRAAAGAYAGQGRVTSLTLDVDGTYAAQVDDSSDHGSWWAAGAPGSFALTSATTSLWASADSDTVTLAFGDHAETLHRSR